MNMRKIIAILAAGMMLCAAIPMGAMSVSVAAAEEVAYLADFEDNTLGGWVNDAGGMTVVPTSELPVANAACGNYVVQKVKPAGDWGFLEDRSGFTVEPNTDYLVTVDVMPIANQDYPLQAFVSAGTWINDIIGSSEEVKYPNEQWSTLTFTFNSGDNTYVYASIKSTWDNCTYYFDNFKVAKLDPYRDVVVNGDFETGDLSGWNIHQTVTVEADAAYEGSYGAHLKDNGTWGGIMDQTISVEAGETYEISFWIQVNQFGLNLQIRDGDASGASLASGTWFDYNNHSTWTKKTYIVTPSTNAIFFNFCGGGGQDPDPAKETDTYIDSFTCKKVKNPSYDGFITNGDFETGDTQSWDTVWTEWADNLSIVEGGHNSDYALQVNHNQYQLVRQAVNVKPNTNYVVSVYNKNASNMTLLVKSCPADANITQTALTGEGDEWTKTSLEFNSGDNSQVYITIMGNVDDATAIVDDFYMVEKSNDGYIVNGNFETGMLEPWAKIWDSQVDAEIITDGHDSAFGAKVTGKAPWGQLRQKINVEPNTNYKVTVWAKDVNNMSLLVKDGNDTVNIVNEGIHAGSEWTEVSATFNSGDNTSVYVSVMVNDASSYGTFDDFQVKKLKDPSFDGYIYNGDFETGDLPSKVDGTCVITNTWYNLWGANTLSFVEGYEGDYALSIIADGQWKQVRQDGIAVEANTTYRLSAWVKNAQNMSFVVKTGDDTTNLNTDAAGSFPAGDEWQQVTLEFNTGVDENGNAINPITSICVLVISTAAEGGSVIIDNITLEKVEEPVVEINYGDADGDGEISASDVILLQKYLADWDVDLGK